MAWSSRFIVVLFACGVISANAVAKENTANNEIVGAWQADIKIEQPAGLPNFLNLFGFLPGGVMTESHLLFSKFHPLGAIMYSPGLGSWESTGKGEFIASFLLPSEGAPIHPDRAGEFLGVTTVEYALSVAEDGRMSGKWRSTSRDENNKVILVATGALTAQRIKPTSPLTPAAK